MSRGGTLAGTLLALAICGLAVPLGLPAPARAQPVGGFEARPIDLRTFALFDLGVVDADQDGDLDVFTTNHLSQESLLANDADGEFVDRLSDVRLDQTPDFPGWPEEPPNSDEMSAPGLYISRNHDLVLQFSGSPPDGEVTGTVEFMSAVSVVEATRADVAVSEDLAAVPPRTMIQFSAGEDSRVVLSAEQLAVPVKFTINEPFPLDQVFVGRRKVSPPEREFSLYLRDRHGIAWADYTGDGLIDAFITRGGLKGQISRYGGVIQDELMVNLGGTFENRVDISGISKGACRGRAAAAVDFDLNSRLDLFVACRSAPPQLYRQRPDGTFADFSAALAGGRVRGSAFEWVDVVGDRDPELIAARENRFVFYQRRDAHRWSKVQLVPGRQAAAVTNLAVADYDNDGDVDIFAAARSGNTLLVNRSERLSESERFEPPGRLKHLELFRAVKPSLVGLANRNGLTASWVDYDNDGRQDLHVFPHGLFHQQANHRFVDTGIAGAIAPAVEALASWFDVDGNGTRDALIASRATGPDSKKERDWRASLLVNAREENHWLEVELDGPPRNRQALGATVEVSAGGQTQTQWVGQSDDSRFSQGHYRLYFGLGDAEEVRSLKVTWPDGSTRGIGPFAADRLLRLGYTAVGPE